MHPTIQISDMGQVDWHDESDCNFNLNGAVHVWQIAISLNILAINDFTELLSADERDRAGRYYQQADRERFVISRGALRILLGRYLDIPSADITFENGTNKKPAVKNITDINIHYNTTHSGNYILIAIAATSVGIDIENLEPLFPYTDILEHSFSGHEIAFIDEAAHKLETFYTLWTRKEALLKATAKGIDDDIKQVPCMDGRHNIAHSIIMSDQNWMINSFKLDEAYVCSLAAATNNASFWRFKSMS